MKSEEKAKFIELYESVNELMVHIGAHGGIEPMHQLCGRVMNALFEIDGGSYRNMKNEIR
jgi:hypothetical protein